MLKNLKQLMLYTKCQWCHTILTKGPIVFYQRVHVNAFAYAHGEAPQECSVKTISLLSTHNDIFKQRGNTSRTQCHRELDQNHSHQPIHVYYSCNLREADWQQQICSIILFHLTTPTWQLWGCTAIWQWGTKYTQHLKNSMNMTNEYENINIHNLQL